MRTPVVMTLGLVLAPCGLLLNLTSTLAPGWRLVKGFPDKPKDEVHYQGLWDICREQSSRERECGQEDKLHYLEAELVLVARGLMVTSLAVTALGLLLASLGVRCWEDEPRFALSGASGLVLFAAGLLSLIPVSWYNHFLEDRAALPFPDEKLVVVEVAYSLVLGYLGSCLLLLGGFSLALSFAPWCAECCRRRRKASSSSARRPSISTVYVDWPQPALTPAIKYYSNGQHRPRPAEVGPAAKPKVGFPMPRPPPKTYTNSVDVLDGETVSDSQGSSSRSTRPYHSSLPCDSDL
ncbi:claudin-23 [Molossus nigricans]|uniref:Claudin 23 n=1 Tax=Molossus molossus TaxID=27622 RepID=A0A7J8GKA6_MOLMO|nr:claudin-23 [Molossus molossus]KAF6460115.1 claudin 23 [Molossus molossus]